MNGQIYKIYSDSFFVKYGSQICICKIRELLKKQKISIVTGDFVEFNNNVITKINKRKNFIKRPAVANIDQILIVSALKEPELDFIQLNRYVSLAKYYKIPAILCFNKEDLGLDEDLQSKILSIYGNLGYKVLFTSALNKDGIEDLRKLLENKITALCGNSGVGKSSLINTLNPKVNLKTQSVSEKLNRGTHTTRHCEIIELDLNTGIIDTPGFSNVKFDFILPKDIDKLFDEIYKYKKECKFSDCLHLTESGCKVINNLDKIDSSRYKSYILFLNEAFEYKEKIKYNGIKTETHNKFNNNKIVAKINEKKRLGARNTQKQKLYKELDTDE